MSLGNQNCCNERSMALTPDAMTVSAKSLRYEMKIRLDVFKAYEQAQREQILSIVNEEHRV